MINWENLIVLWVLPAWLAVQSIVISRLRDEIRLLRLELRYRHNMEGNEGARDSHCPF